MKIAIISDIHGNYPALLKVIDDARSNHVDKFIFIGDYIFDLPFSNEVTHFIMNIKNAHVIKGNKETYLYELSKENQQEWVYDQMAGMYQTYRDLSIDVRDYLINLKEDDYISDDYNRVIYATHILKNIPQQNKLDCSSSGFHKKMVTAPFTHEQYLNDFNKLLLQDDMRRLIGAINASVILFGHNHLQCYGFCDGKLIINPGSCGQPLDFNIDAAYTMLETTQSGYIVHEKRVEYDIEALIHHSKKSTLYRHGQIWSELVFLALKTGKDYFGRFFDVANNIAQSKTENERFFTNKTWHEAYNTFTSGRDFLDIN